MNKPIHRHAFTEHGPHTTMLARTRRPRLPRSSRSRTRHSGCHVPKRGENAVDDFARDCLEIAHGRRPQAMRRQLLQLARDAARQAVQPRNGLRGEDLARTACGCELRAQVAVCVGTRQRLEADLERAQAGRGGRVKWAQSPCGDDRQEGTGGRLQLGERLDVSADKLRNPRIAVVDRQDNVKVLQPSQTNRALERLQAALRDGVRPTRSPSRSARTPKRSALSAGQLTIAIRRRGCDVCASPAQRDALSQSLVCGENGQRLRGLDRIDQARDGFVVRGRRNIR